MTEHEPLIAAAQAVAAEMLRGSISLYDGGRRIWMEQHLELKSGDHRLDPFVYWASEFEETSDPERMELCLRALRSAAVSLLETGSAV